MTNFKKTLLGVAAAMVLAAPAANAAFITVGGVTWDPDSTAPPAFGDDFTGQTKFVQWYVDETSSSGLLTRTDFGLNPLQSQAESIAGIAIGDVLVGVGKIDIINGENNFIDLSDLDIPFIPGGELTFVFGGFKVAAFLSPSIPQFTGGWLNVYTDTTAPFLNAPQGIPEAEASDGNLWLSLDARSVDIDPTAGVTLSTLAFGPTANLFGGAVTAFFDVKGGAAFGNFDTNAQQFGTDVKYTGNARFEDVFGNLVDIAKDGNGQVTAETIPEPATLALVGLGLLGMGGLSAARKRAKA
jgi:hypothetical protein